MHPCAVNLMSKEKRENTVDLPEVKNTIFLTNH